jgi:hypothetical protein
MRPAATCVAIISPDKLFSKACRESHFRTFVNYVRVLDKNQSNLLRRNINAHELAEATFNESGMAQQYGARLAKLFACACLLGGVGVDATYVQLRAIAAHFCCVEKCQRAAMPVIAEGRDVNVLVQRLSSFVR